MNVKLSKYSNKGDSNYQVDDKIICTLEGAEVEVRQSTDGQCMIIAIRAGKVSLEPRAAAIWIVVKEP